MMSWQHSFAFYCPTRRKWLISACAKIPLTILGQTVAYPAEVYIHLCSLNRINPHYLGMAKPNPF